jgi:hypothetical protein
VPGADPEPDDQQPGQGERGQRHRLEVLDTASTVRVAGWRAVSAVLARGLVRVLLALVV